MEKERILTRSFAFCFVAEFCSAMIFYMLITTVTDYARVYGATGSMSGLVSGIFVIGVLITRFLFSRILERTGWKKLMIFAQLAHLVSCFFYFAIHNLATLVLVRFLHGLFYGLSSSANLTVGMNQIPKSRYGEGNGYLMTSITLAIAAGPFFGGLLYDAYGAHGCFWGAVILTIIMCITIFCVQLPPDPVRNLAAVRPKGLDSMIEVKAIPITACLVVAVLGYSSVLAFIRLYGQAISMERQVSTFFIVYAVVLLLSRPLAGKIQDKYNDAVVVYPCVAMHVVSHFILAFWPTTAGIILSAILCAAGYGTLSSCVSAIASRDAEGDRKSYAVATYWIGCDLANGIGPVMLGAVSDAYGYSNMYAVAAVMVLFVAPMYFLLCHRKLLKKA